MEMIGHIYTILYFWTTLALILGTIQTFSGCEYNSPSLTPPSDPAS